MPLLIPPKQGVTVRMYRPGHGDCFLIAFPGKTARRPYYVMIDCGYKPGSQKYLPHKRPIGDIVEHLREACDGRLDLVILTHEHQDHLNGIWKKNNPYFADFKIGEVWLAWTEDPTNTLANDLRQRHRDQLLGLVEARRQLALAAGEEDSTVQQLDAFLSLELGHDGEKLSFAEMRAAAEYPEKSINKQGMRLMKVKAEKNRGQRYCYPGEPPVPLEGTKGIRAFIFGPPEDEGLIADEDPHNDREGFPRGRAFSFAAAVSTPATERKSPFSPHYGVSMQMAVQDKFFIDHYDDPEEGDTDDAAIEDYTEAESNAAWRRIDNEWLYSAETLALKLNTGINNTSLAIAFELPKSKKVLFFAADAQRGNWFSWKDVTFQDGEEVVTTRDLLGRAVLYKVGHHGSHNATLSGTGADDYANLGWMGLGAHAKEFTAMITAVNEWALKQRPPWVHPLPSIKEALVEKARGKVLQTDEDPPTKPAGVSAAEWKRFTNRVRSNPLYFDLDVLDE